MNTDPGNFRRDEIPDVLHQLAHVLPEFALDDLESQLQSFDELLPGLTPSTWPGVANLLRQAAANAKSPECRDRIAAAAAEIEAGRRAAVPYDHEAAMRAYRGSLQAPGTLPPAAYELARVLPQFELADLDDQLRSFDDFLAMLPAEARSETAALLRDAATRSGSPESAARIQKAALDIAEGRRATDYYDHSRATEEQRRAHRINFRRPWETDAILSGTHFNVVFKSPRRSVTSAEYEAFVANHTAYSDPNFVFGAGGEEERWLDAQGRIIAAKFSWSNKDDGSAGYFYYICDE